MSENSELSITETRGLLEPQLFSEEFVAALREWGLCAGVLRSVSHTQRSQIAAGVVALIEGPDGIDVTEFPAGAGWVLLEFADAYVTSAAFSADAERLADAEAVALTARTLAAFTGQTLSAPGWVERVRRTDGTAVPVRVPTGAQP